MDIGTYSHTGYDYKDLPKLYKTLPEAMEQRLGSVHSHHNMGAFYSSEDQLEIQRNANIYDYYLTLIVDTKGTYKAKVGIPVKDSKNSISVKDGKGGYHNITFNDPNEVIYTLNVNVEQAAPTEVPKWFSDRFAELNVTKMYIEPYNNNVYTKPYENNLNKEVPRSTYQDKIIDFICYLLDYESISEALSHKYTMDEIDYLEAILDEGAAEVTAIAVWGNDQSMAYKLSTVINFLKTTSFTKDRSFEMVIEALENTKREY